jgi:hypothetical protein
MNTAQILMMRYPEADFSKDILLRMGEDNMSIEIYEWNLSDPQPTQDEINAWGIEYDLAFRQKEVVEARPYPSVGAQLDMMYHDKIDGTSVWEDTITQIKIDYPKPVI